MTLHVFNPEHDLALAANLSNFTAPHAGRQLRADLGYIPALWAAKDDMVLVENVEDAEWRYCLLVKRPFGRFITKEQMAHLVITDVDVWGWDLAIRSFLMRQGVARQLLPSDDQMAMIRELSHRRYAQQMLAQLQGEGVIGEALMTDSPMVVRKYLEKMGRIVVKAPWSSSGRGVRFLDKEMNKPDFGWISNVIVRQGTVMVEPYYNKVKDFGMEFESDGEGHVSYLGLSLFHTSNGAYTGNILASEEEKEEMISHYVTVDLLKSIQQEMATFTGNLYKGKYKGPFGVDMMVVARDDKDGFLLHPCVEINLRRTMGHVALCLTKHLPGTPRTMHIEYDKNMYKIISPTNWRG